MTLDDVSGLTVLQVHKFFHPHAGSEASMFNTRDLLVARGHPVVDFSMTHPKNVASEQAWAFAPFRDYNDGGRSGIDRARDAVAAIYSQGSRNQLARLLDSYEVDVAHLHLISHQLTFSVVEELNARGIPMVMTMHDYKIGCPAYTLYRDGENCYECVGGRVLPVVKHRCIKGSVAGSVIAATEAALARARGYWSMIDILVCPSQFSADIASRAGFPSSRIRVIQNFLPGVDVDSISPQVPNDPIFFVASRLEELKGIKLLVDIYVHGDGPGKLVIAGAGGALEAHVSQAAASSPSVEYLGRLSHDEVIAQMQQCTAVLVPSLWNENNPISVLEARATGTTVVATSVGGLPEMVNHMVDGIVVEPHSRAELVQALETLAENPSLALSLGQGGVERLRTVNSEDAHYRALVAAYRSAQARRSKERDT